MLFRRDVVDRCFRRFCETGDPDALGDVFDRTAGKLMRVALWLAGNRADAEDLLQRTFVQAIESREQFRQGAPVLPWLMGMLGNQARLLRRTRDRAAALQPTADRIDDPEVTASRNELLTAVRAVGERLGAPYREVLLMHLEQGLNGKEIAARLKRPAGTVRTQLMRALQSLRRRLPDGFVAGLAAISAPTTSSLGAVRESIVDTARTAAPTSTAAATAATSTLIGVMMGKKLLLLVPLLALLTGLGAWALGEDVADAGVAHGAGPAVVDARGERREPPPLRQEDPPHRDDLERVAATTAAPAPPLDPGFAALRVQVRWQDDGSPAAGIGLSAQQVGLSDAFARRAVTNANGVALLWRLPAGEWSVAGAYLGGRLRSPGSSGESVGAVALIADELRTLDAVAIRNTTASGTVVDADGRAVAGARIWVSASSSWSTGWEAGRCGPDGTFTVPLQKFHYLGARHDGHLPSFTRDISASKGPFTDLVVRLRGPAARIVGCVRDIRGKPVTGARVRVGPRGGGVHPTGTAGLRHIDPNPEERIANREGRFTTTEVPPGGTDLWIWAPGFAPLRERVELAVGEVREATWTLLDAAVVTGVLRDTHGNPVGGAGVRFGDEFYNFPQVRTRTAADGRFRLGDLPAWPGTQLVASKDGLSVAARLALRPGAVTEWNPVLDSGHTIAGRVLGPDGRALASLRVGAVHPQFQAPQRWFETDAKGRFTLLNVGDQPRDLRIAKDEIVLRQVTRVAPDTTDLTIRLVAADLPTAQLRGRILGAESQPLGGMVSLEREGAGYHVSLQLDPTTGRFAFGPGPAGRYRLSAYLHAAGRVPMGHVELRPAQDLVLPDLVLQSPGSVELTVTDSAGRPVESARVLVLDDAGQQAGSGAITDGRGELTALQPGHYLTQVWPNKGPAAIYRASIEVRSGVTTPVDIRAQSGADVVVRYREPEPATPNLNVTWLCTTPAGHLAARTATFSGSSAPQRASVKLTAGSYHLAGRTSDGRTLATDFTVTAEDVASGRAVQLELELPQR